MAALGDKDVVGVRLPGETGTHVVVRSKQDRRKPDLEALYDVAQTRPGWAVVKSTPGLTETKLTEDGAAFLLRHEILTAADLQASLTGKITEYPEVKFKADVDEDAGG